MWIHHIDLEGLKFSQAHKCVDFLRRSGTKVFDLY